MRATLLFVSLSACRGGDNSPGYVVATGGNAQRGRQAITSRHCGACHNIPGIIGGHGVIGPSLERIADRSYVAGALPNTPANLVRWIRDPKALQPRGAMPTLGIGQAEASDIAAYLYDLR